MSAEVTPRQLEVLRFIGEFVREHHYPPSFREIAAHFGFGTQAVTDRLKYIAIKGLLEQAAFASRTIRLTERGWAALGVSGCPFCGGSGEVGHVG